MDRNKRLIVRIGIVFGCILLLLTFFSNTIFEFNLASVVVDYPREGAISRSADGDGIVDFVLRDSYYTDAAGKISILASKGDVVSVGTVLYTIDADRAEMEQSAEDLVDSEKILNLRLEKVRADALFAQENLDALKVGNIHEAVTDTLDTSVYDYEMNRIQSLMRVLEKELKDLTILHNQGFISEKEVTDKQTALGDLTRQYTEQEERKQKAIENYNRIAASNLKANQRARNDAAEAYEERKKALEKNIADFQYQISEVELEIASIHKKNTKLHEQIAANGRITVLSDTAGIIKEINEKIDTGAYINKNELIMKIGNTEGAFKTEFTLPDSVNYLDIGDIVTFNIKSRNLYNLSGTIEKLTMEDGSLKAEVHFFDQNASNVSNDSNDSGGESAFTISGGETAQIRVHDTSELYQFILPNSAIRTDSMGDYVLYAEMVRGFFGDEYYARRVNVRIILQNDYNTAVWILSMDTKFPIIINTDKAVAEKDRIRIVGGSELVEIR